MAASLITFDKLVFSVRRSWSVHGTEVLALFLSDMGAKGAEPLGHKPCEMCSKMHTEVEVTTRHNPTVDRC